MIKHSKSYLTLKQQIQSSLDFVLLCCHSIPALKEYIEAVENGSATKIPDPDHFKNIAQHDRLQEIIPNYEKTIGRFLVLSSFSYFESYVKNVINELFEFYGDFETISKNKRNNYFQKIELLKEKAKKLKEPKEKSKSAKYQKIIDELTELDYIFPSELFSVFGIDQLKKQYKRMNAYNIPEIMKNAFGIEITEDEKNKFTKIREKRNEIAHGKIQEVDLSEAINDNDFLKKFAKKIDQHIVTNFFVIESV